MTGTTMWAKQWHVLKRGDRVWAVILNTEVVAGEVVSKHASVPAVTLRGDDGRVITSHPRFVRREETPCS